MYWPRCSLTVLVVVVEGQGCESPGIALLFNKCFSLAANQDRKRTRVASHQLYDQAKDIEYAEYGRLVGSVMTRAAAACCLGRQRSRHCHRRRRRCGDHAVPAPPRRPAAAEAAPPHQRPPQSAPADARPVPRPLPAVSSSGVLLSHVQLHRHHPPAAAAAVARLVAAARRRRRRSRSPRGCAVAVAAAAAAAAAVALGCQAAARQLPRPTARGVQPGAAAPPPAGRAGRPAPHSARGSSAPPRLWQRGPPSAAGQVGSRAGRQAESERERRSARERRSVCERETERDSRAG
eukprot:SAG22_NODE_505_length_9680_cov_10.482831_12_plen_292_part_00